MILHSLKATNFMPYRCKMSITFPTDADKNVMLVFGDNMRGKTSLLNALRWAFYGKAINRAKGTYDEFVLINKVAVEAPTIKHQFTGCRTLALEYL